MPRYVPLLVFLAFAALCARALLGGGDPALIPSALVGHPAPGDFSFGGKVSAVNVFASWCVSCAGEQDALAALGVPVYGLDYKDTPEALKKFLARNGDPYRKISADADGRRGIEWGITGVPETFLIDKNGVVRHRHAGPLTKEIVMREIRPLLEGMEK
jgi:cytochrome c biogenesis protein CcmG/thiol:disulfide interchange protein DsbE